MPTKHSIELETQYKAEAGLSTCVATLLWCWDIVAPDAGSLFYSNKQLNMIEKPAFQPGQLVRLKSQPDKCGAVIKENPSNPETQYVVLLDGKPRSFYASQLIAVDLDSETLETLSADQCRAMLTARYINHPGTSTLYSLNASKMS